MASTYFKNARATLIPDLTSGTVYTVIMLLQGLSLVALLFHARELEPSTALGMRAVLLAYVVINVVVTLTSSFPGATAGPASSDPSARRIWRCCFGFSSQSR